MLRIEIDKQKKDVENKEAYIQEMKGRYKKKKDGYRKKNKRY